MGRKKSQSILTALNQVYSVEICRAMDELSKPIFSSRQDSPARINLANEVSQYWYIICYWTANEIQPCLDIYRTPFTQPIFKALQKTGKFCFAHLKLCQVCWEKDSVMRTNCKSKQIGSAWDLWIACMWEIKDLWAKAESSLQDDKKGFIKALRYLKSDLHRDDIPRVLDLPGMQHNRTLCHTAQHLRKSSKVTNKNNYPDEFSDFWQLFVNSIQRWIEDFRKSYFTLYNENGTKAECRDLAGHWKAINIPDYCYPADHKLKIVCTPLWSRTKLYIKADAISIIL
jgi:hypothetical protein